MAFAIILGSSEIYTRNFSQAFRLFYNRNKRSVFIKLLVYFGYSHQLGIYFYAFLRKVETGLSWFETFLLTTRLFIPLGFRTT